MKNHNGFTLIETLVSVVIMGILILISTTTAFSDMPDHKVRQDAVIVKQSLIIAKSIAVKTSKTTIADFSKATSNVGDDGGLIEIVNLNGDVLKTFILNKNVLLNQAGTTISSNEVMFDYEGQPVDSTGDPNGFDSSNNTVSISFYKSGSVVATKAIDIEPMSGNVQIN